MKATIIIPPSGDMPPRMPVEGGVVADALDSLGWSLWFLDVAAYNMALEAVRVETVKEEPDMVVVFSNRYQYRFAKQYVGPLQKNLPHSLFVAVTDLDPKHIKDWLKVDYVIRDNPVAIVKELANRTETRNFTGLDALPKAPIKLPQYHPLTANFEQHARLRGARVIDVPVNIFGEEIAAKEIVEALTMLRVKYAIGAFNLLGDFPTRPEWFIPFFKGLEEKELIGSPVNLTWTCDIPNPKNISPLLIRELASHGVKLLTTNWVPNMSKDLDKTLDIVARAMVQPMLRLSFGQHKPLEYVEMCKFLQTHEGVALLPRIVEDENRLDDEGYVASLSNGLYLPKSINLHRDMELLATRDAVLSRDVQRLESWAKG